MIAIKMAEQPGLMFKLKQMLECEADKMRASIGRQLRIYAPTIVTGTGVIDQIMYPDQWCEGELQAGVPVSHAFILPREAVQDGVPGYTNICQTVLVTPSGRVRSLFSSDYHGYAARFEYHYGGQPWVQPLIVTFSPGEMMIKRMPERTLYVHRIGNPDFIG